MRILIVEDERKVANFISQGLQEEGHTVEVAKDGEAALDLLRHGPPYDLIVLDVMLPRVDGRREPILRLADLTLDPATRVVARGQRHIELTTREHALLEYFLRNPGRILTRPMLAEHVWGLDFDPESNVVDVYVGYLRRKIDGPGDARLLHTVRGAGYVLRPDAD